MRHTFKLAILAALFLSAGCARDRELLGDPEPAQVEPAYAEPVPETEDSLGVGMFNELRYYGQWYWLDPYGWVWRPTVVSGWQPFLRGHWIWSQYGWMWVDYDPWGWATSHYGYWTTDYTLGWIWIPDYQWSPAQVDWLIYDDWACWAPVAPPGTHWREPWEGDQAWVSIPVRRFKDTNVGNYRTTPKFKAGESERNMIRTAPDVRAIEKYGPRFTTVDVTLDRRVVGEREFAKIKLPADQEQIVRNQRTLIKTNSTSAQFQPVRGAPPTPPMNDDGTTVAPSQPRVEKSKDSGSKDSGEKKETRYKEKKSEERSKDKKDDGKSKDGKDEPKTQKKGIS